MLLCGKSYVFVCTCVSLLYILYKCIFFCSSGSSNCAISFDFQALDMIGCAMVYGLVDAAKEWINSNATLETCKPEESEEGDGTVEDSSTSPLIAMAEPKVFGGKWNYVIGLVVSARY